MSDRLARAIAFERWMTETTAAKVEAVPLGLVVTNDAYRARYDSNLLWTDALPPDVTAAALHAEADRGLAGFDHREILVNQDEVGHRVRPGLEALGYVAHRMVVMTHDRAPDRDLAVPAEEIAVGELLELFEASARAESPEEVEYPPVAAAWAQHLAATIGARFFGVRVDGRPVGSAHLYQCDGVAMVEDVATLEAFRGRGIARACVLAAAAAARQDGADLVFLHAIADDWPRELYAKLGFDPVGHVWSFTRSPAPATR